MMSAMTAFLFNQAGWTYDVLCQSWAWSQSNRDPRRLKMPVLSRHAVCQSLPEAPGCKPGSEQQLTSFGLGGLV